MLFNDREIALARLCQIAGRAADDKGRRPRSPGRETDLAQRTQSCARSPRRASRDLRGAGPRPAGANARRRGYLGALRDLRAKSVGPPRERVSAPRWGTDKVVLEGCTHLGDARVPRNRRVLCDVAVTVVVEMSFTLRT